MKTIILPGYSVHNRDWAYEVKENMGIPDVIIHEWRHWTKGSFNVDYEVKEILRLAGLAQDDVNHNSSSKVNVIAKSVGTSVTMNLLRKMPDSINKIILCGIPINGFGEERKDLFRNNLVLIPSSKVIVFQNEKDNLGSYEKVSEFIHSIDPNIKVVKKPRSDHHYPYPEDFGEFLAS